MPTKLINVLIDPRTFAFAGFLAMGVKAVTTMFLVVLMSLLFGNISFISFCFVLYPIIGSFFDVVLYIFKDKLWKLSPEPNAIPDDWKISSEDLLSFAKQIPKIRLMRIVSSLLVLPFLSFEKESVSTVIISWMFTGYFLCALFDGVWRRVFKIKRPMLLKSLPYDPRDSALLKEGYESMSRNSDPSRPGSGAWFAQQNIDSM